MISKRFFFSSVTASPRINTYFWPSAIWRRQLDAFSRLSVNWFHLNVRVNEGALLPLPCQSMACQFIILCSSYFFLIQHILSNIYPLETYQKQEIPAVNLTYSLCYRHSVDFFFTNLYQEKKYIHLRYAHLSKERNCCRRLFWVMLCKCIDKLLMFMVISNLYVFGASNEFRQTKNNRPSTLSYRL